MLKKNELEKILIKNWSLFLDIRKLLELAKSIAENELNIDSPKITTLTVSHCEIVNSEIIIWIDYKILEKKELVNATTELIMRLDGSIDVVKTI